MRVYWSHLELPFPSRTRVVGKVEAGLSGPDHHACPLDLTTLVSSVDFRERRLTLGPGAYLGWVVSSDTDPWSADDHLAGRGFLEHIGHPVDQVWTGSAGYNEAGDRQILVYGLSNLEIVSSDGDVLLDVGHRNVRGVRRLVGVGVEVCLATAASGDPMSPGRWIHRVSDRDAAHLEGLWLDLSPMTHSGVGLIPLHWREDEYAYFVGRVITEASKCEVTLADLVVACRSLLGESTTGVYGESGKPLAVMLDGLGKRSLALADIAERYRAWAEWRDFAAHGIRHVDKDGHVTDQVYKVRRGRKVEAQDATVDVKEQDFANLALTWHAFYMLNHDASDARTRIVVSESPEQVLRNLPKRRSVSESERLPPA